MSPHLICLDYHYSGYMHYFNYCMIFPCFKRSWLQKILAFTVFSISLSAFAQLPISEWDNFVSSADGSWYQFDAATTKLSDGYVAEEDIKTVFNASDAFLGLKYKDTRFKFESTVPELGIPGLLCYTPTGANNANYLERVSVPRTKDKDYTPAREVAVRMDYFLVHPGSSKTNDVEEDIRTYYPEPHVKRNGLQTYLEQPASGSNPGPDGEGAEFVLLSQYGPDTYTNNFPYGNKGDVYGLSLPQGYTTFDLSGTYESFDPKAPTYTQDRTVFAVGVYSHDVTDYNYQSQIYPCYPNTNIRLTFPAGELIQNRFLIGLNTTSNGVSNQDGYFHWWLKIPSINNGQWFLAATLVNRDFTGDLAMQFANLGIGQYNGGNGKGYYLDDGKTANGIWFNNMSVYYKGGTQQSGGGGSSTSNNAPVVALTSPKDGAIFNPGDVIPLVADAADSDGTIAKIEFIKDGFSVLGTEYQPPYNIDWTNAPTGTYTLNARATDNNGAVTLSSPITITVLNQSGQNPPTVTLTSPVNGSTINLGDKLTLSANASDADGSVVKVEFYEGNTLLHADGNAPFEYTWTSTASGTYSFKAVATDNAALTTTSSVSTITVVGPNADPVVSIIKPSVNATYSQGDDIEIEANASDTDGSIWKVEFFVGTQLITTEYNAPYEAVISNAQVGKYTLTAVATDNSGGVTTSAGIPIEVLGSSGGGGSGTVAPPTIDFLEPLNGSAVPAGSTLYVEAAASQPAGSITEVIFFLNDTQYKVEKAAPYQAPLYNVQPGTYLLEAIAYDNFGNTDTAEVSYTVTSSGGSTVRPSVSIIKPLASATYKIGSDIDVEATATDSDGTINRVEFFLDGVKWRTEKVIPYTGTLSNMQAGSYSLMAIAYDNSGLTDSSIVDFIVSNSAPNIAPDVEVVNPIDGQTFNVGSTVEIDVEASDSDGSIDKVEIYVDSDLIQIENNYPYEASQLFVFPGTYKISAIAYDDKGESTQSKVVEITIEAKTSYIKGLFFDAVPDAGLVILSWGAKEEEGMKEFRISKSADSVLYQQLTTQPAVGSSSTTTDYDEIDPSPFKDVSWYKLEAIATDGSVLETIIVRIDLTEPDLIQKWIVYPNPLSGNSPIKIWASLTEAAGVTVDISSVYGAAIYSDDFQFVAGTNKRTIGLETLPPGMYFFTLRLTQTGEVLDTKLFIKNP